ncbi:MAG: hypothetical protein PHI66_00010 [Candidatus Pacebacteria bacterium]|nr:hypothetical protein [Candidatus Paceibacterota bacterium]
MKYTEEKKKIARDAFWNFRKKINALMEKYQSNLFVQKSLEDAENEIEEQKNEVERMTSAAKRGVREIENDIFQKELSEGEVTEVQDAGEDMRNKIEEAKREYYKELETDMKNIGKEAVIEIEEDVSPAENKTEEIILADEDEEARKVIEEVKKIYADEAPKSKEEKIDKVAEVPAIEDESEKNDQVAETEEGCKVCRSVLQSDVCAKCGTKKYSLVADDILQGKKVPEFDEYIGLSLSIFKDAFFEQGDDSDKKVRLFSDVLRKGFDLYLNSFSETERTQLIGITEGRGSVFIQKIMEEFVAVVMEDSYVKDKPQIYDEVKKIREVSRDKLVQLLDSIQEKNKGGESFDAILNFSEENLSEIEKAAFFGMKQVLRDAPLEMKERTVSSVAARINEYERSLEKELNKIKGK